MRKLTAKQEKPFEVAGLYVERKEIMVGALGGLSVEELLAEILLDSIEESAPEADLINRRSVKYHG